MSQPKTLLQMAGAPSAPGALDESILILIDCQREYVDGKLALPGVAPALAEGNRLLATARAAGTPVVHVVHNGRPGGGIFDPETPFVDIAPEVAPADGEETIVKAMPNAFVGTDLDELLKKIGRKELLVAGFMSHMCISSTVRAGVDLGYRCTVIAGAVATRDLPDGRGGVIGADDLHRASMAGLSDRFAIIIDDATALS